MEVKERIIVESGRLFGKYGIRSMTMDALAEELGISKRTIYERFKDKDTLLLEVVRYYQDQQADEAHRIIEESDHAIEALFRIIRSTVNQMQRIHPSFMNDFRKYHARVFIQLSPRGEMRNLEITRNLLETGVRQKVFRKDLNIPIVNRALHALFDLFGPDSSLNLPGQSHREMFDHIIIPYFRGISTDKGIDLLEQCKSILDH